MKDKYNNNNFDTSLLDSVHYGDGQKFISSKNDLELFDEAKAVAATVVRIKRTNTAGKGERWKIMKDDELLFIIEGSKISKKEREFLRSVAGVSFLTKQIKMNVPSLSKLKAELKNELKEK